MAKVSGAGFKTSNQGSETGMRCSDLYSGRGRGLHQSGVCAVAAGGFNTKITDESAQMAQKRAERACLVRILILYSERAASENLQLISDGMGDRTFPSTRRIWRMVHEGTKTQETQACLTEYHDVGWGVGDIAE